MHRVGFISVGRIRLSVFLNSVPIRLEPEMLFTRVHNLSSRSEILSRENNQGKIVTGYIFISQIAWWLISIDTSSTLYYLMLLGRNHICFLQISGSTSWFFRGRFAKRGQGGHFRNAKSIQS
jgi:hypothetical protein